MKLKVGVLMKWKVASYASVEETISVRIRRRMHVLIVEVKKLYLPAYLAYSSSRKQKNSRRKTPDAIREIP